MNRLNSKMVFLFQTPLTAFSFFNCLFMIIAIIVQMFCGVVTSASGVLTTVYGVVLDSIIYPYAVIITVLSIFTIHRHITSRSALYAVNDQDTLGCFNVRNEALAREEHSVFFRVFEFSTMLIITAVMWYSYGDFVPTIIVAVSAIVTMLLFTTAFSPVSIGMVLTSCAIVIIDHFKSISENLAIWLFTIIFTVFALRALWLLALSCSRRSRSPHRDSLNNILVTFHAMIVIAMITTTLYLSDLSSISVIVVPIFSCAMCGTIERESKVNLVDYQHRKVVCLSVLKTPCFDVRGSFKWMAPLCVFLLVLFIPDETLDILLPFGVCVAFFILDQFRLPPFNKKIHAFNAPVQRPPPLLCHSRQDDLEENLLGDSCDSNSTYRL